MGPLVRDSYSSNDSLEANNYDLLLRSNGIDLLGIRMKVDRNYRQERIPVGQPTGEVTFPDQGLLSAKPSGTLFLTVFQAFLMGFGCQEFPVFW